VKPNATCSECGKRFHRPPSHLKRAASPKCSRECNGKERGREWAKHGHKGRSGWADESLASCRQKMTGPGNPAWKGGVTYFRKKGNYKPVKYVRCPEALRSMARKDGYIMEHRLLVATAVGRPLTRAEVVHHVNHDPQDNRLANLTLFRTNSEHKRFEAHGTPEPIWSGSSA
jgi:hypothetical protein